MALSPSSIRQKLDQTTTDTLTEPEDLEEVVKKAAEELQLKTTAVESGTSTIY